MRWHSQSVESVVETLDTDLTGLSNETAATRLQEHGPNELRERDHVSPLALFAS